MRYLLFPFLLVFVVFAQSSSVVNDIKKNVSKNLVVDYIYIKDTKLRELLNILSIMTGINTNGTESLINENLSFTSQGLEFKQLIKEISNSLSDSVPYYDMETNTYRIVKLSEYDKFARLTENHYKIEVFSVRPVNLTNIAVGIEEIYGERVQLSLGGEILDFSSSGGGSSSSSSGGGNSSTKETENDKKELTREEVLKIFEGRESKQNEELPIFMSINNEHSAIIIRTKDLRVLGEIKTYINTLNLPVKQVMLEMQVLNISLTNVDALGISLNADKLVQGNTSNQLSIANGFSSNFSTGIDGTSSSLLFDYFGDEFNVRVLAALQDNRLETISNPVIVAMNNRTSTISVGESRRIVTGFSEQTTIVTNGVTTITGGVPQLSQITIGTELSVIPRIFNDHYLNLYVSLNVDSLGDPLSIESIDTINVASFDSSLLVKNKEIVAIGGIIRKEKIKTERKVPFLSRLPIIGELFKSEENRYLKSELLLLVRPHILSPEKPEESVQILEKELGVKHSEIVKYNERNRKKVKKVEKAKKDKALENLKLLKKEAKRREELIEEEKKHLSQKLTKKTKKIIEQQQIIEEMKEQIIQEQIIEEQKDNIENELDKNIQNILQEIDLI